MTSPHLTHFDTTPINEIATTGTTLFWFRRDLRIDDNAGLYYALKENNAVLPVFIFDTQILKKLDNQYDLRITFIYQTLLHLKQELEKIGSSLFILYGDPIQIFDQLSVTAVYANHDYEPYSTYRDETIREKLKQKQIPFKTYKDHVIFEKYEVIKSNQKPYTIFTPYSHQWKKLLTPLCLKSYPTTSCLDRFKKVAAITPPRIEQIGFYSVSFSFPPKRINVNILQQYSQQRDFPATEGTTKLGVHLRFGTLSIRKLAHLANDTNATFLNELIWRDFYQQILWHFPTVETHSFKPLYDKIEWLNEESDYHAWCNGKTGYPIVDAGMRELNATGFMHNRVRMIVASFLTKHLLIDWRWGEAYFSKKLLDYDLAANNGGWQWAAGSGCDAAPYFRIFNPELQTKKFDTYWKYIKKWIPEIESGEYPKPIVDHKFARERVLNAYQKALLQT